MAASKFKVDASARKLTEAELNSGIGNDAGNNPNSRSRLDVAEGGCHRRPPFREGKGPAGTGRDFLPPL